MAQSSNLDAMTSSNPSSPSRARARVSASLDVEHARTSVRVRTPSAFACAACAKTLEFVNVPERSRNAPMEESFVILAPELALRARKTLGEEAWRRHALGGDAVSREGGMEASFVVLPERAEKSGIEPSVMARVFDVASELSERDHPLCDACSSLALTEVERRTREVEAECAAYEEALERLREAETEEGSGAGVSVVGGTSKAISNAVMDMEKAERDAEETLRELELELETTRAARSKLAKKAAALDEAEDTYWREFHAFKRNLNSHLEKRDSILTRTEQAQAHLDRLEKTNVFNDSFHIWTDGAFGTINGFRLGRLPNVMVEWDEINAAFGLACLLLHSMARICKFTFTQYTLKPMGSFPKVSDANGGVFELFGPVSIISSHKYDKAVLGFLTCLSELSEFMKARDVRQGVNPPFQLPFTISNDKVDGKKMSFTFNRDENWTYALKLMLTDLKLMLAWLSHKD